MIEKWRRNLDDGGQIGAVITDLSKAFIINLHVNSCIHF